MMPSIMDGMGSRLETLSKEIDMWLTARNERRISALTLH